MKRGDVYWVNLDPTVGAEIRKKRPCVIIGATPISQARHTVIILPLSTSAKARPPLTIKVKALKKSAVVVCDQIRAIDKSRLINHAGELSRTDLTHVEEGLKQVLVL